MEGAFDAERARGVLVEHDDPVLPRRARGGDGERAREVAQVMRVLDHVVPERVPRKRAVGEAAQERMAEDRVVDGRDRRPQLSREGHGLR